jgi:hypothetical protein
VSESSDTSEIIPVVNDLPAGSRKRKSPELLTEAQQKRRKKKVRQEKEQTHTVSSNVSKGVTVQLSNNDSGKRKWDKVHYCLFCSKSATNIRKHYFGVHKSEPEVRKILELPLRSKSRSSERG